MRCPMTEAENETHDHRYIRYLFNRRVHHLSLILRTETLPYIEFFGFCRRERTPEGPVAKIITLSFLTSPFQADL